MNEIALNIPSEYCCPITKKLMIDPVLATDGYCYEREAITEWFEAHNTSPTTKKSLTSKELFSNHSLKDAIQVFFHKHISVFQKQFTETIKKGDVKELIYLEKLGINFASTDEKGWTILHHAAYAGKIEDLKFCLSKIITNINTASHYINYFLPEISLILEKLASEVLSLTDQLKSLSNPYSNLDPDTYVSSSAKELANQYAKKYYFANGTYSQGDFAGAHSIGPSIVHVLNHELHKVHDRYWYEEYGNAIKSALAEFSTSSQNVQRQKEQAQADINNKSKNIEQSLQINNEKINKFKQIYNRMFDKLTPLHLAIIANKEECVISLLDKTVDIEFCAFNNFTPLFFAVIVNKINLVRLLIRRGANTQAVDLAGNNLLHIAAIYSDKDIIDY